MEPVALMRHGVAVDPEPPAAVPHHAARLTLWIDGPAPLGVSRPSRIDAHGALWPPQLHPPKRPPWVRSDVVGLGLEQSHTGRRRTLANERAQLWPQEDVARPPHAIGPGAPCRVARKVGSRHGASVAP